VLVYAKTYDHGYWHARRMCELPFFSNQAIYAQAALLFAGVPSGKIKEIGVTCYELSDGTADQLSLFGDAIAREQQVTDAIDMINTRFGDRTIHAADTLATGPFMKQKIPFGSTRYL
jgi:hypothetical protein